MKKNIINQPGSLFIALLFIALSFTCCKSSKYIPVTGKDSNETTNQTEKVDKKIYEEIDEPPQYKGGDKALMKFISEKTVYPKEAAEARIQGRVLVKFVIDPTGKVVKPEILEPAHELLDAEAIRVISSMPKWKPGRHDGELVYVYYTMPLLFKLPPKTEKE